MKIFEILLGRETELFDTKRCKSSKDLLQAAAALMDSEDYISADHADWCIDIVNNQGIKVNSKN